MAADIVFLAAMLEQPLAVKPEHAAMMCTVKQLDGIVELLACDIGWMPL